MFEAPNHPTLVPYDASFEIDATATDPKDAPGKKQCKKELEDLIDQMDELQRLLYAHDKFAILLVFQAMDAAGKDSTIRAVMSGVNPAGCQVFSFKQPTPQELDHDLLWRCTRCLPERGRIGIFNRSYYEEVLVVRVHPQYLRAQKLPHAIDQTRIWQERYESILEYEKHLARNGTVILKFWLNVSKDEQRRRFLDRIAEPSKNWKFSAGDVAERSYWKDYMAAYQAALNATSRPWAPWYAIPADNKPFMRLTVAEIIVASMQKLNMAYPKITTEEKSKFEKMRKMLLDE